MDFEEQRRLLWPYLKRAEEIEKHQPKIAYYLRLHAADLAIALGTKNLHPDIKALLISLMDKLDKTKSTVGLDKDGDPKFCEDFASSIFNKADKADRAGKSDKTTVATFYASKVFFDMLEQFTEHGGISPEIEQKRKYAIWRAGTINKALSSGQIPEPPPGQEALNAEEEELLTSLDALSPPTKPVVTGRTSSSGAVNDDAGLDLPAVPSTRPTTTSKPVPDDDTKVDDAPPKLPPPFPPPPVDQPSQSQPPQASMPRPVRQFEKGQAVLYLAPGTVGIQPVEGTITKITLGGRGKEIYHVSLKKNNQIVQAEAYSLAPALKEGDAVTYFPGSGPAVTVTVEEVYASRWPPTYMVQRQGGGLETVEDDDIALVPTGASTVNASSSSNEQQQQGGGGHLYHHVLSDVTEEESETVRSDSMEVGIHTMLPPPPHSSTNQKPNPLFGGGGQPPSPVIPSAPPNIPPTATTTPLPPPPSVPQPPQPTQPVVSQKPPVQTSPVPVSPPSPPPKPAAADPNFQPSVKELIEAEKMAKTAASSISFEDVPTAVKYLQDALKLLTSGKKDST